MEQAWTVLVDVDGTLAGKYRGDRRPLRPGAADALRRLSEVAEVYLWSVAGRGNPERLLREYPELRPHVHGTVDKSALPPDRFDRAYCIDDEEIDPAVLARERIIVRTYDEGDRDDGLLVRSADRIGEAIRASRSG